MYAKFYGFQSEPFSLTPDSRFLYPSARHEEALAALVYGVQHRKGFIAITGEIGSGKTTLCRAFMSYLDRTGTQIALILNPDLNDIELLQSICAEFGIPDQSTSKRTLLHDLNQFVLQSALHDKNCVLIIDEAQNLPPRTLEQVRMISNLETERDKLIQIVLVGQPQLDDLLHQTGLEQLNQRITVRYHLEPLHPDEVGRYVGYRLSVAKPESPVQFTDQAVRLLTEHTGGVPRRINVVCDRALLITYLEETWIVERRHIEKAIAEVAGSRPRRFAGGPRRLGVRDIESAGSPPASAALGTESVEAEGVESETAAAVPGAATGPDPWAYLTGSRSKFRWLFAATVLVLIFAAVYAVLSVAPRLWRSGSTPWNGSQPGTRSMADAGTVNAPPAIPPGAPLGMATLPSETVVAPTPLPTSIPVTPTPSATTPTLELSPTPSETPAASPSPEPSPSESLAPSPSPSATDSPAPTPPVSERWSLDKEGVVRVDRADLSLVASVVTWLGLEGKAIDLASLKSLLPEQVAGLELATGRPPLWLRRTDLPPDFDRLRIWSRWCLLRLTESGEGVPSWCVLESVDAESGQARLLDPLQGARTVPFSDVRSSLGAAIGLYMDFDNVTGIRPGDEGTAVARLQELLRLRGLLPSDLPPTTSVFDRSLSAALADFQQQRGLPASGTLDGITAWLLLSVPR